VRTHFEYQDRLKSRRLADLKSKKAELEQKLSDTRMSLERELAEFSPHRDAGTDSADFQESFGWDPQEASYAAEPGGGPGIYAALHQQPRGDDRNFYGHVPSPEARTELLVNHGRRSASYRGFSRQRLTVIAATAVAAALITVLALLVFGGGASWPASVATVQSQAVRACQNPDVRSEPGQVNFACTQATRQILWVFALLTSGDNPNFADARTGRLGLEPITPAQGGEIAWSLNLHQPYRPANPVDSLEVAARAINNIIGGATVTGANGQPVVQPGLESSAANCVRYTGSPAVTAHRNFPGVCSRPVTSSARQTALVADIYRKWVIGATPTAAQDAGILFANADNPGAPEVQAILRQLPKAGLAA
jgi:hypothetical protein